MTSSHSPRLRRDPARKPQACGLRDKHAIDLNPQARPCEFRLELLPRGTAAHCLRFRGRKSSGWFTRTHNADGAALTFRGLQDTRNATCGTCSKPAPDTASAETSVLKTLAALSYELQSEYPHLPKSEEKPRHYPAAKKHRTPSQPAKELLQRRARRLSRNTGAVGNARWSKRYLPIRQRAHAKTSAYHHERSSNYPGTTHRSFGRLPCYCRDRTADTAV
jgi:hypothetical protein